MKGLPRIAIIYPEGTGDDVIFSEKVEQHAPGSSAVALEKRLTFLPCDQGKSDISKNVALLQAQQPDVIILCPSMRDETLETYSEQIYNLRPGMRTADPKLIIYHYDNQSHVDPENDLANTVDEYFPTLGELIQALLTDPRM